MKTLLCCIALLLAVILPAAAQNAVDVQSASVTMDHRTIIDYDTLTVFAGGYGSLSADAATFDAARDTATAATVDSSILKVGFPVDSSSVARLFLQFVVPDLTGKNVATASLELFPIADSTVNSKDFLIEATIGQKIGDSLGIADFDAVSDTVTSNTRTTGTITDSARFALAINILGKNDITAYAGDTVNIVVRTVKDVTSASPDTSNRSYLVLSGQAGAAAHKPRLILGYYAEADTSDVIMTLDLNKMRTAGTVRLAAKVDTSGTQTGSVRTALAIQVRKRLPGTSDADSAGVIRTGSTPATATQWTTPFPLLGWAYGVYSDSLLWTFSTNGAAPLLDVRIIKQDTVGAARVTLKAITY